jgi:hypothetical protein
MAFCTDGNSLYQFRPNNTFIWKHDIYILYTLQKHRQKSERNFPIYPTYLQDSIPRSRVNSLGTLACI